MKSKLLVFIMLAIALCSCSSGDKPNNFDYGSVNDGKYVNSYFDFEIAIPSGWSVQTKEQMDAMANTGKALATGDNEQLKAVLKASEVNTANLLSVFQYEVGSAVTFNPNFCVVAENIKNFPGIKTGSEYLFQARRFMEQSQVKYSYIDQDFVKETINGTDFYHMKATMSYMGLSIEQSYYATVKKGFAFIVIASYINDDQQQSLKEVIGKMKFAS